MRFLADESCDFAVVRALRKDGHDVLAVSDIPVRSVDAEIMDFAHAERRILLTEDKDFGWLAFVAGMDSPGVILIRFPGTARPLLVREIRSLVAEHGSKIEHSFVVVRPGVVRFSQRYP